MFGGERISKSLINDIENRIQIVSAGIKTNFAFLADYGFSFIKISEYPPEGNFFLYGKTFIYSSKQLEVLITYYPIYCEFKELKVKNYNSISISINRIRTKSNEQKTDYVTNQMSFNLYLEKHVKVFDEAILKIPHYPGSFREKVDKILKAYVYFLKDYGEDILKGKVWYDDCDPVYN